MTWFACLTDANPSEMERRRNWENRQCAGVRSGGPEASIVEMLGLLARGLLSTLAMGSGRHSPVHTYNSAMLR
jgi:hypothetical protein